MTYKLFTYMAGAVSLCGGFAAEPGKTTSLQGGGGNVTFDATTNFSAVSVHGKANALYARVRVRQDAQQLLVEEVSAKLPVGVGTAVTCPGVNACCST